MDSEYSDELISESESDDYYAANNKQIERKSRRNSGQRYHTKKEN